MERLSWKRIDESVELSVRIPEDINAKVKLYGYSFEGRTEFNVSGEGTFVLLNQN